jgi:sugar lactone lactonase YvrE
MKTKKTVLKSLALVASAVVWCGLNLHGQSAPTITTQPASQTNLPGTNVTFSVAVAGAGPYAYQWQLDGTNLLSTNVTIAVVAGNGNASYAGDGGPATAASLNAPSGAAADAVGNLYIADSSNNRIRKVNTSGVITTVAINGKYVYSGDGVAATNTSLGDPGGVAVDAAGNLYIAAAGNDRIRKVGTNGVITTVAGGGSLGDGNPATNAGLSEPYGVALDALGNLYIADTYDIRIKKVGTNGIITTVAGNGSEGYSGDGGAATNAKLDLPDGVTVDSWGNLYIADSQNYCIREVATNGIIKTIAGTNIAGFSGDGGAATNARLDYPTSVALDGAGDLYIADSKNERIREVATNGIINTFFRNSYTVSGVAFDAMGNLYIADTGSNCILKAYLAGPPSITLTNVGSINAGNYTVVITTPYGSVTSAVATLTVEAAPAIAAQPASQIVVAGSSLIFSVGAAGSGQFEYLWFFDGTNFLQSGASNTLTLADVSSTNAGNYTVVVTNAYGGVTSQVAALSVVSWQPSNQTILAGQKTSLSVTAAGAGPFRYQWQLNGTNLPPIITTVAGGESVGNGGPATNAEICPFGAAVDAYGNLYIADTFNSLIREVGTNGIITTFAGNGSAGYSGDGGAATNARLNVPEAVALDAAGNLYIADIDNQRIREVDTNGIITTVAGNGIWGYSGDGRAATNATVGLPQSVAVDGVGNLYMAETILNSIRKVDTNGIITTVACGALSQPNGVAADGLGNMYIADTFNQRIRKVDTNGNITTVAGGGTNGLGDGGTATNAELNNPYGVAVDGFGNLYVADTGNERIRYVATNGIITTLAGTNAWGFSGDGGAANQRQPVPAPRCGVGRRRQRVYC